MATVADYAVLRDANFTLEPGESFETQPFFAPDAFVAGTNLAKAILAYKVTPLANDPFAAEVDFTVSTGVPPNNIVNVNNLRTQTIHGLWEAFPATGFGQNIGRTFLFSVRTGRARFGDVVLWYQVEV